MKKNEFNKLKIINKKINYNEMGNLRTLKGTDNIFWYAYSRKLDITFKSMKTTNVIKEVWNGKKRITKDMIEIPKKVKIKSCLKWYQKLRIEIMSTVKAIILILFNYRKIKKLQEIKWPTKI